MVLIFLSQNEKVKIQNTIFLLFTFEFLIALYSVLKLFTGFAMAAFMAWKLTVINAINNAANAAIPNTHQFKSVL